MSEMSLSERALAFLSGKKFEGVSPLEDPVEFEGGRTYLKFDAIIIKNMNDEIGGTNLGFEWRGKVMLWKRIEPTRFVAEGLEEIRIDGITGRQETYTIRV